MVEVITFSFIIVVVEVPITKFLYPLKHPLFGDDRRMRVEYTIFLEIDSNDYVKTLGEINDVIQDNLKGNPEIATVKIYIPRG